MLDLIKKEVAQFLELSNLPLKANLEWHVIMIATHEDCHKHYHMNIIHNYDFLTIQLMGYVGEKRVEMKKVQLANQDFYTLMEHVRMEISLMVMPVSNWNIKARYSG